MLRIAATRFQESLGSAGPERTGTTQKQIGLKKLGEAMAPIVRQSEDVALNSNANFGGSQACGNSNGIGAFLGETRYYQQSPRGELTPVRIPPRNAEEAQQFAVDSRRMYNDNQDIQRTRWQIENLRRSDNGPTDQNPQPGVVVESGWFGPRNGRGGTQVHQSLTYDRSGQVDYEKRVGPAGSSAIESYQGDGRGQFRYMSGREGQMPQRVIETTREGLVRSSRSPDAP